MPHTMERLTLASLRAVLLRLALFGSAASLALYIPYKYATQLHAITGLYAFLFPLSGLLALAGIALAVKPEVSCNCSAMTRIGAGGLAAVWMVTGLLCVPSLVELTATKPWGGLFATLHMTAQHIVLSLSIIVFAILPRATTRGFGGVPPSDLTDRSSARIGH